MHSDFKDAAEAPIGHCTSYSRGGINRFKKHDVPKGEYYDPLVTDKLNHSLNNNREGWYGWVGFGGSVMNWHPELNIGFGYVPTDLLPFDAWNQRGAFIQKELEKVVRKMK